MRCVAFPFCFTSQSVLQKVSVGGSRQSSNTNTLYQGWDTQVLCARDQRAKGLLGLRLVGEVCTGWPKGFVLMMVTVLMGPSMEKFWMWTGELILSYILSYIYIYSHIYCHIYKE